MRDYTVLWQLIKKFLQCAAVVTVVVFEFSGMRCQPLRRALTGKMEMPKASEQKGVANVSLWAMPSFRKS